MLVRIWPGWTSHQCVDAYEKLLQEEIFAGVAARNIYRLGDIKSFRRKLEAEVEFITIMSFASLAAVREFGGEATTWRLCQPSSLASHEV